jgi:aspartyl protease family protein
MRFDLSSLGVMALAVASALTTAWWLNHADARGQAHAATPAAESAAVHAPARGGPAQVLKAADGHYWADALIDARNGQRAVRVMIDTGASVVVLTPADAARLGLRLGTDDFTATVITASGPVRAAPVALQSVAVSGARVEQVEALVVEHGLPHSLLGMSYLGRLSSFSATPVGLTLRP